MTASAFVEMGGEGEGVSLASDLADFFFVNVGDASALVCGACGEAEGVDGPEALLFFFLEGCVLSVIASEVVLSPLPERTLPVVVSVSVCSPRELKRPSALAAIVAAEGMAEDEVFRGCLDDSSVLLAFPSLIASADELNGRLFLAFLAEFGVDSPAGDAGAIREVEVSFGKYRLKEVRTCVITVASVSQSKGCSMRVR